GRRLPPATRGAGRALPVPCPPPVPAGDADPPAFVRPVGGFSRGPASARAVPPPAAFPPVLPPQTGQTPPRRRQTRNVRAAAGRRSASLPAPPGWRRRTGADFGCRAGPVPVPPVPAPVRAPPPTRPGPPR